MFLPTTLWDRNDFEDQKIEADPRQVAYLESQWRKWNNSHALWCQSIRKGKLLKFHSKMPSLPAATFLTHNPNKFGFPSFCVHGRFKGNMALLMPGTTLGTLHTLLHLSFGTLWNKQYPTRTDRVGSQSTYPNITQQARTAKKACRTPRDYGKSVKIRISNVPRP